MTIYDDMALVADDMLTEFGQGSVQLVRKLRTGPPNNPVIGVETAWNLRAAVKGVSRKYLSDSSADTASRITEADLMIVASPIATLEDGVTEINLSTIDPEKMTDQVRIDGVLKSILRVVRIPAAGTVVVYNFVVKG